MTVLTDIVHMGEWENVTMHKYSHSNNNDVSYFIQDARKLSEILYF